MDEAAAAVQDETNWNVCFAEGTDPDLVAMWHERAFGPAQPFGGRYTLANRWTGSQGAPITVTWSFVPDGLTIPSGVGEGSGPSNLFAQMDSKFATQGGRATWIARVQSTFDRWSQISGISFTRITVGGNDWDDGAGWTSSGSAGLRGDIRLSGKTIDGASGVLAYNSYPGTGSGGNMVLDTAENWGSSTTSHIFLRNTVAHELGHGIGLAHTCSNNSGILLEPFLSTSFDGPQQDDARAVQRHYGDNYENDNSAATAVAIGSLAPSGSLNPSTIPAPAIANARLTSIDANAETDYFRFTVTAPLSLSVTVTPIGTTYDDNTQSGGGSCNTGSSTNALQQANLAVEVLGTNGTTVLASATAGAIGVAETISALAIDVPGDYYVRVFESDSPVETQTYNLALTAAAPPCPSDPTSLAGNEASQGTASLNWVDTAGTEINYRVQREQYLQGAWGGALVVATLPSNSITFSENPGQGVWRYSVQAVGAACDSAYTAPLAVKPRKPMNLQVSPSGSDAQLTWTDDSDFESKFGVQRQQNVGGNWSGTTTLVSNLPRNTTAYTNTPPSSGQWRYRIRCTSTAGNNGWTGWVSVTIP